MSRLLDHYETTEDFESALDAAESNARTTREEEFLAGLRDKYEEYADRMFLSDAQYAWLERLGDE